MQHLLRLVVGSVALTVFSLAMIDSDMLELLGCAILITGGLLLIPIVGLAYVVGWAGVLLFNEFVSNRLHRDGNR